jgi:hypothetical protein
MGHPKQVLRYAQDDNSYIMTFLAWDDGNGRDARHSTRSL